MGLLDTWDYEFNFTHLALSKYSLTIAGQNSLNIGFDSEATHTTFSKDENIMISNFKDKRIDIKSITTLTNFDKAKLLKNCGFHKAEKKLFWNNFFLIIASYRISIIFCLRVLKRKIAKNK